MILWKAGKKNRGSFERCLDNYIKDKLSNFNQINPRRVSITHPMYSAQTIQRVREAIRRYASRFMALNTFLLLLPPPAGGTDMASSATFEMRWRRSTGELQRGTKTKEAGEAQERLPKRLPLEQTLIYSRICHSERSEES